MTTPDLPLVYLDHAATTPMLAEAVEAMTRQLSLTGNANSLHGSGRTARRVVEESRERIAQALGARPGEVVFTSGGTEADNLALKGIYWARRTADPRGSRAARGAHRRGRHPPVHGARLRRDLDRRGRGGGRRQ